MATTQKTAFVPVRGAVRLGTVDDSTPRFHPTALSYWQDVYLRTQPLPQPTRQWLRRAMA